MRSPRARPRCPVAKQSSGFACNRIAGSVRSWAYVPSGAETRPQVRFLRSTKLLGVLAVVLAGVALASPARAVNIVPNGDFEACSSGGVPSQWSLYGASVSCTSGAPPSGFGMLVGSAPNLTGARAVCVNRSLSGSHAASFAYSTTSDDFSGVVLRAVFHSSADCPFAAELGYADVFDGSMTTTGAFVTVAGSMTAPTGTQSVEFFVLVSCAAVLGPCGDKPDIVFDNVTFDAPALAVTLRGLSAVAVGGRILVRWRTASELDALGFHVYREVGGQRVRVSRTLVAAKGGGLYSFLDRQAPRRKALRYWVQTVELTGARTWHGPARLLRR